MNQINKFKCGLCKNSEWTTRKALRKHIGEQHARNKFTNDGWDSKNSAPIKRRWWIIEVFE